MAKAVRWDLIADPRRFIAGFDRAERKAKGFHASISRLGTGALAIAGGAGIGALVVGAGKLEKEWGDATDAIRTGTGKTGKAWGGLVKDFNRVAVAVPASLMDVGTAIADLNARTGQTGKGLQDLAKREIALARVTKTDLKTNIAATTRLFGDWSIKTEDQAGTLDKLFRASQATGAGVDILAQSVVQFGSPLRQLGFDLDTTVALFGEFEKTGVNIQTALPGLRMALKNFAAAGREPAPALVETIKRIKEAGSTAEANKLAFKTFGVRAGPDLAAAIREGHFDLDKLIKTIASGHDTIMAAEKDTEGFTEAWKKFTNLLKVHAGPVITEVFDAAGERVNAFTGFVQRDLTPRLGGLKQAWNANRDAILGVLNPFQQLNAESQTGAQRAQSLADSLEGVTEFLGEAARLGDAFAGWLNAQKRGLDEGSTAIHDKLIAPISRATLKFGEFFGLRPIGPLQGVVDHLTSTTAELAGSTDRAAAAADRHAGALRSEKSALEALQGALDDEKTSEIDLRQAKLNVSTAQKRVNDLKADGKTKSFEYKQAQLDLERAQIDLRHKTDDYRAAQKTANAATASAMRASQDAARAHRDFKGAADKAGGAAWLMGGKIKDGLLRIPKGRVIKITATFGFKTPPNVSVHDIVGGLATGGRINVGTGPTADDVLVRVSKGETVVSAGDSSRPEFRAWAQDRGIPGFARGGVALDASFPSVAPLLRSFGGFERVIDRIIGRLATKWDRLAERLGGNPAIQAFIRATDPLPYRWGAAGPGAYDCSGLVSAVYGKHTGRGGGHGQRYFTTASISATGGLKPGLGGVLNIGVTPSQGHMAGTYGGLGFEARSTRSGIIIGPGARSPSSFARHFHMAKGGKVDRQLVELFARLAGADIGGDAGRLRVDGKVFDQGGWLPPGTTVATNRTGQPERVMGPGEPLELSHRSMRTLARHIADALVAAGVGATYLDSRRAEQVLAGARLSNARR